MIAFIILPVLVFSVMNAEYLDTIHKEIEAGARWHEVDGLTPDPKAKSIPLNGKIYWKLKKGE
jgi:hypothetical protein